MQIGDIIRRDKTKDQLSKVTQCSLINRKVHALFE